jgi:hypothetical protein
MGGAGAAAQFASGGAATPGTAVLLLLGVVFVVNLACMPATFLPGDPYAWREEAKAMLTGELAVSPSAAVRFGDPGQYFVLNPVNGRWYSKYGVMNAVMALPPTVAEWLIRSRIPEPLGQPDLLIFNLYQLVLTLAVCAVLWRLSAVYTNARSTRMTYVLAVFYGTFFWYYQRAQSAEIYQVLFYACFFYGLRSYVHGLSAGQGHVTRRERAALLGAWLCLAALVFTRVLFGLLMAIVPAATGVVMWKFGAEVRRRVALREAGFVVLPAVLIGAGILCINRVKFGSPWLTGYHQWRPEMHYPAWANWSGLYGLVFDMQGSVLWYFPVLIFALLGLKTFYERYPLDAVLMWASFGVVYLVLGKTSSWRGEWTYGPRYLLFALPVVGLPFLTFVDCIRRWPQRWLRWSMAAATAGTLVYSAYLQERTNRLDFFAYYQVSVITEGAWNREMARDMLDRHVGAFCAELLSHRDNLDALPWVQKLPALHYLPEQVEAIKDSVRTILSHDNYYWRMPSSLGRR